MKYIIILCILTTQICAFNIDYIRSNTTVISNGDILIESPASYMAVNALRKYPLLVDKIKLSGELNKINEIQLITKDKIITNKDILLNNNNKINKNNLKLHKNRRIILNYISIIGGFISGGLILYSISQDNTTLLAIPSIIGIVSISIPIINYIF